MKIMKKVNRMPLRLVLFLAVSFGAVACNGEKKAEKAAREFLQAYYVDLDFERARERATDRTRNLISEREEMTALNPYAKEEIPSLQVEEVKTDESNPDRAVCRYSVDRRTKTLVLVRLEGEWLVNETGMSIGSGGDRGDMMQLSEGDQGGFASAVSGPVIYKPKNKNKKAEK